MKMMAMTMTMTLDKIHNQPAFKTFCNTKTSHKLASSAKKASTENQKCQLSQATWTNKPACQTTRTTRIRS